MEFLNTILNYDELFKGCTTDGEKVLAEYNKILKQGTDSLYDSFDVAKDDAHAHSLRIAANKQYGAQNFIEALKLYNQSLCFTDKNLENFGIVYSNRSAVYFELGYYETCLKNIDLALGHNCPHSIKPKLMKRQQDCLERINNQCKYRRHEDDEIEVQLSYKANDKIPCMVEGIEIVNTEKFGRSLVATRDFKPGDILINEPLFCNTLNLNNHTFEYCFWCLKGNLMSLLPCKESTKIMFCSEECYKANLTHGLAIEATAVDAIWHLHVGPFSSIRLIVKILTAFDDFDELQQILNTSSTENIAVFALDYASASEKDCIKAYLNLVSHHDKFPTFMSEGYHSLAAMLFHLIVERSELKEKIRSDKQKLTVMEAIYKTHRTRCVNSFAFVALTPTTNIFEIGMRIALISSLLNHSCAYNSFYVGESSFVLAALRPIKAGDHISIGYFQSHTDSTLIERITHLKDHYYFDCTCIACRKNYPTMDQMKPRNQKLMKKIVSFELALQNLNLMDNRHIKKVEAIMKKFNKISERNDKYYPGYEVCYSLEKMIDCTSVLYHKIPLQPYLCFEIKKLINSK